VVNLHAKQSSKLSLVTMARIEINCNLLTYLGLVHSLVHKTECASSSEEAMRYPAGCTGWLS